jgi:Spy/CpxP family protein refolding chaperone
MRKAIFGLALIGAVIAGTAAQAGDQPALSADDHAMIQPVYWGGGDCGPRCREHRWREHERWEAHRRWERHRWEERHYGYYAYPRY